MTHTTEPITRTQNGEDLREDHPAFGCARFAHVQHGGRGSPLFRSHLDRHPVTVELQISRATLHHHLGYDRHHAGELLVKVEFSPAQFAELLTSMNLGEGVPCTILRTHEGRTPEIPREDHQTEQGRVRDAFREDARRVGERFHRDMEEIRSRIGKLRRADQQVITDALDRLLREVEQNMPFMVEQFDKATTHLVTAAKADVDATITHAAQRLGFERLQDLGRALQESRIRTLEAGSDQDPKETPR